MIISLIAALAEDRVIGNKNRIPWHIKDDLIRFKQKTLHHTVVMGRTTFDSLMGYYKKSGRPVPVRNHIIVTRDKTYIVDQPNCFITYSVEEAFEFAKTIEKEEVFVSGGASLFKQTIKLATRLHLTIVHGKFEGDTYFPAYPEFTKVIGREEKKTQEGLAYTFLDLER
jgi:dihydrofolate reductase